MSNESKGHRGKRRRRVGRLWPLALLALVTAAVLGTHSALGGFTAAAQNTGDKVATGSLLTTGSGSTSGCDLTTSSNNPISTANSATCNGQLLPTGTLPTGTTQSSANTTITNKGSVAASTTAAAGGSCGPIQLADAVSSNADPMLVRGAVSYAQTGPLTGGYGLGLASSGSEYAADVAGAAGYTTTSFSMAIWFKTTASGTLMGFTNTPSTNSPGEWDKMLWLDPSGYVVFGVYPSKVVELATSGTSYLDGKWHLAVASLSTSSGMSLSVDGGTPVTSTGATSAQSYNGYWHVGWDNETSGWTDPPSTGFFTGTLADAAVFSTVLSSSQITALKNAGSQSTWVSTVAGASYSTAHSWALGDSPGTPFTGTVPSVSPSICSFADLTLQATTGSVVDCVLPASAGTSACGTPSSSYTLASIASSSGAASTGPAPGTGSTQYTTLKAVLARDGTNTIASYPNATGLNLTISLTVTVTAGGFTANLVWPTEDVIL